MGYIVFGILYGIFCVYMLVRMLNITEELVWHKGDVIWLEIYEVFILLTVVTVGVLSIPTWVGFEVYYKLVPKRI